MIKARNQEKSTPSEVQKKESGKSKPLVSVIGKTNKNAISVDITTKDVNEKTGKKSPANKVKKESNTKKNKEEVVWVGRKGVDVSLLVASEGGRMVSRARRSQDESVSEYMVGFPVPKVGDMCILWMKEARVVDVNRPAIGFATIIRENETKVMWLAELWSNINQDRWYFKQTKQKHDWDAIKQHFFESDYMDVLPFLKYTYGIDVVQNWWARERTKWWWDEKKALQKEIKQKAFEEFKTTLKKQWDGVFEKLEFAHVQGLEHLANMIIDQGKITKRKIFRTMKDPETWENLWKEVVDQDIILPYLTHWDITAILKHIKLEKGEPTDIVDTQGKSEARAWLDDVKKQKEWKKPE